MTLRVLIPLICAAFSLLAEPCAQVTGDTITGRDLKTAGKEFENVADDATIALSPMPGVRRTLTPRDLAKFATTRQNYCFERGTLPFSATAIEEAMRSALEGRSVTLEIVDFLRTGLPEGKLQFTLSGLSRPSVVRPDAPVLWRGRLLIGSNKSMTVWATVRVSEKREWLEAVETLKPGVSITAEQVRLQSGERFLLDPQGITDPNDVVGLRPRRSIAAGQVLQSAMFERAPVIVKGETVSVEVVSGAVSLRFDALAEMDGRSGEQILVFDAGRKRRLKVKAIEKGKAILETTDSTSNIARVHNGGTDGVTR